MAQTFDETLKKIRIERGFSQQQLAEKLFVDRSSVAHWESGRRVPNALMITRIANALQVDISALLDPVANSENEQICVIVVDDERIVLTGEINTLQNALPNAVITGFTNPNEALGFARNNPVHIAFTDIEMPAKSGLDLCGELMDINPNINVIFLTAFSDYSLDAWNTKASGFMVKPITEKDIGNCLELLRHPVGGLH